MKFPSFKKKAEEPAEKAPEESKNVQTEAQKEESHKIDFSFSKDKEKTEKKGMFAGMMERMEQKQKTSSLPSMTQAKPKAWSVAGIKYRLKEYKRVLKITKKPTTEEFKTIVKASGLGIIVIGLIGFAIHMLVQTLQRM